MKKITTLTELAAALGKKTNVKAWEKNGKQRLYFGSYGYNTKKMSTKAYIDLRDGKAFAAAIIDCPSQPNSWIQSQEQEIRDQLQKYVRYIVRFFDFGVTSEPIEVILNNATLAAEEVQGYYTKWEEVSVPINRFGKLAVRNRQFVLPWRGSKSEAPRTFVPFSVAGYNWLLAKGQLMLEPYAPLPDIDERAAFYIRYEEEQKAKKEQEKAQQLADQRAKEQAAVNGKARMAELVGQGVNFLQAWKEGGCQHPAPAEIVEAKKASGLNWTNFTATL
jgi:hypothetical protein